MLGSALDEEFGKQVGPPKPGCPLTQSTYIVVEDIESCYERVQSSGSDISMPLTPQDHGGSLFSVLDPKGQLWNIGSYDPWRNPPTS
jgi:uncharacterized glyoxalase superfamily protein PhnB